MEKTKNKQSRTKKTEVTPKIDKRGAPKGNQYALKPGEDLQLLLYLSKYKRAFLEEWFQLKYGRTAINNDELRQAVRTLAHAAIDHAIVTEFERQQPGRTKGNNPEVF
jgi:hypothetical protein